MMAFAAMAGQFAQIGPMLEMVTPILQAEPEVDDNKPPVDELKGVLEVSGVAFRYNELNLAVFAAACAGACIGFLWFNCYPASIFMGDTGSLALGAAFAALAVLTKTEVTSLIMGGLFIAEALSVIIQVVSFKSTGKRVFLMAPIHHHFEKKGWSETKVVIRFWIVSAAFASLGFALYFQLR